MKDRIKTITIREPKPLPYEELTGPLPLPNDYRLWKGTAAAFFDDAARRIEEHTPAPTCDVCGAVGPVRSIPNSPDPDLVWCSKCEWEASRRASEHYHDVAEEAFDHWARYEAPAEAAEMKAETENDCPF